MPKKYALSFLALTRTFVVVHDDEVTLLGLELLRALAWLYGHSLPAVFAGATDLALVIYSHLLLSRRRLC